MSAHTAGLREDPAALDAERERLTQAISTPGTPESLLVWALVSIDRDERAHGLQRFIASIATNRQARRRGWRRLHRLADRWRDLPEAVALASRDLMSGTSEAINTERRPRFQEGRMRDAASWVASLTAVMLDELAQLATSTAAGALTLDLREHDPPPRLLHVQSLLAAPRPGPGAGVTRAAA